MPNPLALVADHLKHARTLAEDGYDNTVPLGYVRLFLGQLAHFDQATVDEQVLANVKADLIALDRWGGANIARINTDVAERLVKNGKDNGEQIFLARQGVRRAGGYKSPEILAVKITEEHINWLDWHGIINIMHVSYKAAGDFATLAEKLELDLIAAVEERAEVAKRLAQIADELGHTREKSLRALGQMWLAVERAIGIYEHTKPVTVPEVFAAAKIDPNSLKELYEKSGMPLRPGDPPDAHMKAAPGLVIT